MRTDTPVQTKLDDYTPYPFAIESVDMAFDLEPAATRVRTRLNVTRLAPGDMLLDGIALTLNAISIDGAALPESAYTKTDESLTLLNVPDAFTLDIDVTIDPSANTVLSGLYMSGGRFCTQCESVGFRRITYWPDRPDVMSRFKVRLEASKATYPVLLSNGTPGERGDTGNDRHFATWDDPHPKPSYLFALCAGDYDVHRDSFTTMSGKHVDLAVHVDKGDATRAVWAMDSLKASMKWDEDTFAREYDLGVFNIVAVRDFNFGAMENKGLNVFNSAYVLADEATATDGDFEAIESIVAHEYFHNWTGNRITCRDWFQLCLKEGLTVFRDQEFSADMRSRPVQRIKDVIALRARQFTEDAGPLAHPVRPDSYASIDNLYTATVYEKGAELIRMLKTMIGDNAFARGMQIYFDRHDGEATTIEHFYACFEEASGQDLTNFRRWYSQPGTPTLTAAEDWDEQAGTLSVTFTQFNPKTPGNDNPAPLPMPIRCAAFNPNGDKTAEQTVMIDSETTVWTLTGQAARPLLSLNRGFSAPVRLEHQVSDETRLATARLDDDAFNTFNALQSLLKADLLAIAYGDKTAPDATLITAVANAVRSNEADPAFAALLTRLPSVGELFLEHTPSDPVALSEARKTVERNLATALLKDATRILSQPSPAPFDPGVEQAAVRSLRSAMIALLATLDTNAANDHLADLFDNAPNMTESLSTLRALCTANAPHKQTAISTFAKRWADNPIVIDKWFAVQAATGNAAEIEALTRHPGYDLGNPNRVRSVVGVFAMQNLAAFHAPDGAGHAIVANIITQADKRNPALAARLLQSFEQWKKLEPHAKASAEAVLENLKSQNLSQNAADIIARALG
ncbi:MAG: aminopeptidase N [Henriciella sp.]|nr:aminopeptidase N [Henriciella sp.]